ncbi:MAG: BadF/BadG/BcrA/BcrD ATPase family protein [Pseudomonadota bacterium]
MKMTDDPIIVAADGGGTGSRAAAGTVSRGIIGEGVGGPGNVHSNFDDALRNLTGAVSQALKNARLDGTPAAQITAHFGVAGAHSEHEMRRVMKALPYGTTTVTGDRATSVRGVLGEDDGFVVALGTGTIVARQRALNMKTVGGWGFDLSDQASGAWLGKRLLQEAVLAEDGLRAHTALSQATLSAHGGLIGAVHFASSARPAAFAPLAREVLDAAKSGDTLALALVREGAAYLVQALSSLGFAPGDAIALAGGLGPHYAAFLPTGYLSNRKTPLGTALEGAFSMARAAAKARM